MGIILTTISTFFSIINTLFSIINTLFMLVNLIIIGTLIFAVVYIGPKIKGIFDGYNAYQSLTTKLSDDSGSKCLTQKELEEFINKIKSTKSSIEQLKNIPGVASLIPKEIETMLNEIMNNINSIPICQ